MTVKYECPKCGRRFAEWGAEKMNFLCPKDASCPPDKSGEDIELFRLGAPLDQPLVKTPAATKRTAVPKKAVATDDDDIDESDDEDSDDDKEEEVVITGEKIVADDDDDDSVSDDVDADDDDFDDSDDKVKDDDFD